MSSEFGIMRHSYSLSKYLFALFALFVFFSDELFLSIVSFMDMTLESGMKSKEAIIIAIIAYILLFFDILNRRLSSANKKQFFALFVILFLYFFTGQFYYPKSSNYWSHLLVYGALCIPACYVGMRLAREWYYDEIIKLLPFFVLFIVPIISSEIMTASAQDVLLGKGDEEGAFNYQSASYYIAFSYSFCFFYVFFRNSFIQVEQSILGKIVSVLMLGLLFISAIGCVLGGGRGAFIYFVVITVFLVYRTIKRKGKGKALYILLMILGASLLLYLVFKLKLVGSVGFERVRLSMTVDEGRNVLWRKALSAFSESPLLGHGLGSIWWTVGYYSHNMLTDLLAEVGILGTSIVLFVLIKCLLRLFKDSYYNPLAFFLLLLFLSALVHDSFSGYWISSSKLFLAFGYVFSGNKQIAEL